MSHVDLKKVFVSSCILLSIMIISKICKHLLSSLSASFINLATTQVSLALQKKHDY